ncbi:hypothetical protein F5B18DRAFT_352770 [Nemania serpens]|nr:hypothetical protein F5B18DRAFT_352770 [Nemania serpens]
MTTPPPARTDESATKPDQALLTTSPVESTWEAGPPVRATPSNVTSQKCSIAEYGWAMELRSAPTLTPSTSAPSESGTPSSEQGDEYLGELWSPAAFFGITIGGFLLAFLFALAVTFCFDRWRRRRQNTPDEPESVATGNRQSRLRYSLRFSAGWPLPNRPVNYSRPRIRGRRREGEQAPVELRSWPAFDAASAHESQGRENIASPTSDQVHASSSAH